MSIPSLASLAQDSDFTRSLLESIGLFRGVDPDTIADLLPRCGRIDVAEGDVLLSPERTNHCVYVVLSGRLAVHLGSLHAPKIADLAAGSCAGEMSLIEDKDPSAFVVAVEDSHLMVISHHLLWQLVDRSHTFSKNLARRAVRARALGQRVHREQPRRVAPGSAQRAHRRSHGPRQPALDEGHVRARGHARAHEPSFSVSHDDRHRPLQDLQRSVRPHRRRPRARRGQRSAARVPAADRLDRALRRRRVRGATARHRARPGAADRRAFTPARRGPVAAELVDGDHDLDRREHESASRTTSRRSSQRADSAMYDAKESGRNRCVRGPRANQSPDRLSIRRARPSHAAPSTISSSADRCALGFARSLRSAHLHIVGTNPAARELIDARRRSSAAKSRRADEQLRRAALAAPHGAPAPAALRPRRDSGFASSSRARPAPQRRADSHVDGQAQVRDHPLHQHELLIVLLAEARGRPASRCSAAGKRPSRRRRNGPAGSRRQSSRLSARQLRCARRARGRTGRSRPRSGTNSRSTVPAEPRRALSSAQRARVRGEVLARPELRRIDEDAHDDAVAPPARERREAHVARVQIAHRRHERDALARRAPAAHGGANVGRRCRHASRVLVAHRRRAARSSSSRASVHQAHEKRVLSAG